MQEGFEELPIEQALEQPMEQHVSIEAPIIEQAPVVAEQPVEQAPIKVPPVTKQDEQAPEQLVTRMAKPKKGPAVDPEKINIQRFDLSQLLPDAVAVIIGRRRSVFTDVWNKGSTNNRRTRCNHCDCWLTAFDPCSFHCRTFYTRCPNHP
ncbi:hypothetical protein BJ741DRAFT_584517 [Chytriomyces cf. hyalinus JEL632]|nr:hypothetical protein BJ741DRAFT_584517 [Chytriomyces cf. hyalinus JEL632]